jgi:hypothetical protein
MESSHSSEMTMKQRIIYALNNMVDEFHKLPHLRLVSGAASISQWKAFASQRLLSAGIFEDLISRGIVLAGMHGHTSVQAALVRNLRDEMGMNAQGDFVEGTAHAQWRADFCQALQLKPQKEAEGGHTYVSFIRSVITSTDPFVVYGAILALERLISVEFIYIREGMNQLFPAVFIPTAIDSENTQQDKLRARRYIDDHIDHDAKSHFPELLEAVMQCTSDEHAVSSLLTGLNILQKAKTAFYEDTHIFCTNDF